MQHVPPPPLVYLLSMAPSICRIHVSPLRLRPSFTAAKVHPRTFPGILWALVRWVNCWLRPQAPPCLICNLASLLVSALHLGLLDDDVKPALNLFCLHGLSNCPEHPGLPAMPKLLQRMSSRRGSSRGKTGHQASSSTTDSSTLCSDFSMDRYPATRSGRGRGRGLHNLETGSLNSNSARLQFPCSHGNLSFMASVTIELKEINSGQVAGSLGATTKRLAEDRHGTIQMNYEPSKASGSAKSMASQIMKDQAGPSVSIGGGSTCREGHPSKDKDDYQFGCRIIEEQPDPSHGV